MPARKAQEISKTKSCLLALGTQVCEGLSAGVFRGKYRYTGMLIFLMEDASWLT